MDVTWIVFSVLAVCVLLVMFSSKITTSKVAEFWVDFFAVTIVSGITILFIPEDHFTTALHMILLSIIWFITGQRYILIMSNKLK